MTFRRRDELRVPEAQNDARSKGVLPIGLGSNGGTVERVENRNWLNVVVR